MLYMHFMISGYQNLFTVSRGCANAILVMSARCCTSSVLSMVADSVVTQSIERRV